MFQKPPSRVQRMVRRGRQGPQSPAEGSARDAMGWDSRSGGGQTDGGTGVRDTPRQDWPVHRARGALDAGVRRRARETRDDRGLACSAEGAEAGDARGAGETPARAAPGLRRSLFLPQKARDAAALASGPETSVTRCRGRGGWSPSGARGPGAAAAHLASPRPGRRPDRRIRPRRVLRASRRVSSLFPRSLFSLFLWVRFIPPLFPFTGLKTLYFVFVLLMIILKCFGDSKNWGTT